MKKITKITVFIIISFSIVSACKEKEDKRFAEKERLEGLKPDVEAPSYGKMPKLKFVYDSVILVKDVYNKNYTVNLINAKDFSHITTTGKIGKGPNEINKSGNLIFNKQSKNSFLYLDLGKYKFFRFKMKNILKEEQEYLPQPSDFKFKKGYMPAYDMKMFNDSIIAFNGNTGRNILYFMNSDGKIVKKIGEKFYERTDDMPEIAYAMATKTKFAVNPDKSKIAIGYGLFNKLICLDTSGKKLFEFQGEEFNNNFKVKGAVITHEGLKTGYRKLIATDNYIFALYNGKIQWYRKDNTSYYNYPNTIQVFNWHGDPVMEINLDREIHDFLIDKEEKRIIACETKQMNPFVIYEIPEELELN